jgi:hypothetical protein
MRKAIILLVVCLSMVLFGSARADDLTGANVLLCTAVQATVCTTDGDCEIGPPWNWNIPQFIQVDLGGKILRTTKASGENRSTPIKNLERVEGNIFIQGVERGRAFSFVIEEETGYATIAVAREGIGVTVFGACTTSSASR